MSSGINVTLKYKFLPGTFLCARQYSMSEITNLTIQGDSKRWTQRTCTSCTAPQHTLDSWLRYSKFSVRCAAVADSVLMNSRTQKILCCIVAILLSTDAAARLCARQALLLTYLFTYLLHGAESFLSS